MGLTIHYSGNLKNIALINQLIADIEDICKTFNWKYHILHDEDIDGILFTPPESKPVHFTFNKEGRLLPVTSIILNDMYENNEVERELIFTAFTKTQFAGLDAHKAIIKLIRYITQKYFSSFKLTNESYYLETNNEQKMPDRFKVYNAMIDVFCEALEGIEAISGENPKSLADKN